jgi:predicted membrane protein
MSNIREHSGRIFWGLVLIIVGGLFLLESLHKADAGEIISRYWPVILIAVGLWILFSSGFRNTLSAMILVAVGAIFLLINLGIFEHDVWNYAWPLFIVALGLWLILRGTFRHPQGKFPEIKGDDLDAVNMFSGMKRTISSQKFRGGKATAIFGGMELDFTQAGLDGGQATVDVTAIFGGIEIWVPKEWKVVVDATPILGGVDDKHRTVPEAEVKGTLYVKATAIFGGVEIKN